MSASGAIWRGLRVALLVVLLVAVAAFVIQAFPGLVGADYAFIVQSGSMEPTLETGATVFVATEPVDDVAAGDVITYHDGGGNFVTHRVVEVHRGTESVRFTTKGDANENVDGEPVYRPEYVGTVMTVDVPVAGELHASVPLMGRVVAFAGTWGGYAVLLLLPALLLLVDGVWTLYNAVEPAEETHD